MRGTNECACRRIHAASLGLGFPRVGCSALSLWSAWIVQCSPFQRFALRNSWAFFFEGRRGVSDVLFAINAAAFAWLALITLVRLVRFGPALWADLMDPGRVFGFFTIIAGSDVFGAGLALRNLLAPALALWVAALVRWLVLIYVGFMVLTLRNAADGADIVAGGWLNAIVGTQSLVVLGAVVAPLCGPFAPAVFVLIHTLWGIGLALYGIFIALFAARLFFRPVVPDDLTPMLWVVMGAAAIGTNAGSVLIVTNTGIAFLTTMRPFIDAVTLMVWAWATWWIPLLVMFGAWKRGVHRVPLTYTPLLWCMVFPARHVFARDRPALARRRFSAAAHGRARDDVARARCLGRDCVRAHGRDVAECAG
jgi:hypothetical protein